VLHRQLLEMVIILLAVLVRRGYYEVYRLKITNVPVFNFGDRLAIGCACTLWAWAATENLMLNDFGQAAPSFWLLQSLRIWLWISGLFPLLLLLLHFCFQRWGGNFLTGLGRGCLSFGLPIALLPVLCWFPR
jgi:hypothetical protein